MILYISFRLVYRTQHGSLALWYLPQHYVNHIKISNAVFSKHLKLKKKIKIQRQHIVLKFYHVNSLFKLNYTFSHLKKSTIIWGRWALKMTDRFSKTLLVKKMMKNLFGQKSVLPFSSYKQSNNKKINMKALKLLNEIIENQSQI